MARLTHEHAGARSGAGGGAAAGTRTPQNGKFLWVPQEEILTSGTTKAQHSGLC